MWERIKEVAAGLLLVAFTGYLLYQMVLIRLYGEVTIVESSPRILYSEIGLLIIILALGIERLVKYLRKRKEGK